MLVCCTGPLRYSPPCPSGSGPSSSNHVCSYFTILVWFTGIFDWFKLFINDGTTIENPVCARCSFSLCGSQPDCVFRTCPDFSIWRVVTYFETSVHACLRADGESSRAFKHRSLPCGATLLSQISIQNCSKVLGKDTPATLWQAFLPSMSINLSHVNPLYYHKGSKAYP